MTQKKKDTIKSLATHDKDVGSTEIQIGLLTDKIAKLAEHFKTAKKDKHSESENIKGQLISKCLFENSNFFPCLLEQKFFVRFLEELKNPKCLFQIN